VLGNIIAWLIVGAIAGWLAGYIMTRNTKLDWMDVILGIVGAIVGGWLGGLLLKTDVQTFSPLGVILAVIGALIVAFGYKLITKKQIQ
jgi:uncharacterized membrane protein YeaQ/YmgE (transglycosylase-associated protein family)